MSLSGECATWSWGQHSQHDCTREPWLWKEAIAHSQQPTCLLCLASFLICYSDPFPLLDLSSASSVRSWMYSICGPQLSSAHACTWESMCLSIMRFKMGKLILSKWQVCLSRWEGMTFLPSAASSPLDSPTKEYFNRRLMEGTQNKKKTLSSLFRVFL